MATEWGTPWHCPMGCRRAPDPRHPQPPPRGAPAATPGDATAITPPASRGRSPGRGNSFGRARSPNPVRGPAGSPRSAAGAGEGGVGARRLRVPPRAEGGAERRGGSPGGAVRGGGAGALTGDKGSAGRRRRRRAPGPLPPCFSPPPPYGAAARRLSHVRRRRRAPSQRWAAGPCRPHSPVAHPASPLPHHPPSAPRPDPPAPAPPAPWRGWTPDGRRPRAGGDAAGYLRRRVKRQQEERLREQSLRALELEPLHYEGYGGSPPGIAIPHRLRLEPHHHHPHHIPPPRPWSCRHESDLSKPPCYEEALLMAEPPPPYSEVLMDTRGLYRKINAPFLSHERLEKQEQPPSYKPLFLDAGYGSALHLPRSASPSPACPDLYLQAECSPRMFPSWTDSELSSRDTYEPGPWHLPVSMPLFGRTTAV
ncbi:proline-rich protein 7 isoform X1 [Columba livia]